MDPIGQITPPSFIPPAISATGELTGVMGLLNSVLRILFIVAGLYAFFNFVLAGFGFISAGGDPKAIAKAWEKIWQSFLGLIIIASSFLLAAIIGLMLFGNATALINPTLQAP